MESSSPLHRNGERSIHISACAHHSKAMCFSSGHGPLYNTLHMVSRSLQCVNPLGHVPNYVLTGMPAHSPLPNLAHHTTVEHTGDCGILLQGFSEAGTVGISIAVWVFHNSTSETPSCL